MSKARVIIKWVIGIVVLLVVIISVANLMEEASYRKREADIASDLTSVTVDPDGYEANGCPKQTYAFTVHNKKSKKLRKVEFTVVGTVPGRSTEYDLGSFTSDFIVEPKASKTPICYGLLVRSELAGQHLEIHTTIQSAEFAD
jgi:hypothetical protein